MARTFASASSEYLQVDATVVNAYPYTLACWFNVNDITNAHTLMWIGDKDFTNKYTRVGAQGNKAGDPLRVFTHQYTAGMATGFADSTIGYTANTWHHACATLVTAAERNIYLDGGNKGTNTANTGTPLDHDRIATGANRDSTPGAYADGSVAEMGVWDVELTDAEIATLAAGYSPLFVRPGNLVFYLPMIRDADNDLIGGLSMTAGGTPTVSDHPRIIYPKPKVFSFPSPAPAVQTLLPVESGVLELDRPSAVAY